MKRSLVRISIGAALALLAVLAASQANPGTTTPAADAAASVVLYGAAADNSGVGGGGAVSSLYRIDATTGAATVLPGTKVSVVWTSTPRRACCTRWAAAFPIIEPSF